MNPSFGWKWWTPLALVWAFPCTAVGLVVGLLGLLTGGHARRVSRTVEFWGGAASWLLRRVPLAGGVSAMTLGHVILGADSESLHYSRSHEQVHVRQYERWGPFFFPAYFGAMIYLYLRGRRPYWDNPFEVEAYDACPRSEADDCRTD